MTLKIIDLFIKTVDPDGSTVVSSPEFIAVFGGSLSVTRSRGKPKSLRDACVRWILQNRVDLHSLLLLPESYNDWSDFDNYSDLLLFEQDLGYLTSAVVIFLEAPGAIAELGAFSQIDSLSRRLVIVVSQEHHPRKSFISLGPIRNVTETKKFTNSLCVIPNVKPFQFEPHVHVVTQIIEEKRHAAAVSSSFNKLDMQHEILLILDLINLFLAPQITELQQLVSHFGIEIKSTRLNQILFLLEKTELIKCEHYGKNKYYVAQKFRKQYVDYRSKKGERSFHRDRFKTKIWEELEKDSNRKYSYESATKERHLK